MSKKEEALLPYRLILLDRDGVINRDLPESVRHVNDFEFLPGALNAIKALSQTQLKIAIVTNQAVVGRRDITSKMLEAIHKKMCEKIKFVGGRIDKIYTCTDTAIAPNNRRKPAPGMLLEAMRYFMVHPEKTIMIGDDLRDLQAAQAAGCDRILVRTGKGNKTARIPDLNRYQPTLICKDLQEAADFLLQDPKYLAL